MTDKDHKPLEQYHDMWRHNRKPHPVTPLPVKHLDHYPRPNEEKPETQNDDQT